METPAVEQIRAWLIELPMVHAFTSARSALQHRRIVVLSVEGDGVTGWGEAAPVPGHTVDDADGIWTTLRLLLAEHGPEAPTAATGLLAAAFAQAADDASAKLSNEPLWRRLGGTAEVMPSAAIGVDRSGRPDMRQVDAAAASGYRNMKLKVTPACGEDTLRRILDLHPGVSFGADANGSFDRSHRELLGEIDSVGLAYLEQPGARNDLEFHRDLRAQLQTPIALDESVANPGDIPRVLAAGAADVITLKTGLLGPSRTLQQARSIVGAGIGVRLGGLIESGIGRAHAAALAGHPVVTWPSDIAGSDRYFADDLVRPQWRLQDGLIRLSGKPGIGVTVDRAALTAHSRANLTAIGSG
jgi:O-succinylbenzoate synthase